MCEMKTIISNFGSNKGQFETENVSLLHLGSEDPNERDQCNGSLLFDKAIFRSGLMDK